LFCVTEKGVNNINSVIIKGDPTLPNIFIKQYPT